MGTMTMFRKPENLKILSILGAGAAVLALIVSGNIEPSANAATKKLTVYSGREEKIIGPLIQKAQKALGLEIEVRYGDSNELAIALVEEGRNSRADVFYAQDVGALGAIAGENLTMPLPNSLLQKVDRRFRSDRGHWVGISGRARVIAYNKKQVQVSDLPVTVMQLTDPKWRGKVGWAPANGSFQSFVNAMRVLQGDKATMEWLKAMKANGAKPYPKNGAIVEALGREEIALGLVNNYYLYRYTKTNPNFPVANHHTRNDAGALINAAGLAVLKTTDQQSDAEKFVAYMLTPEAQEFLTNEFHEYPLVQGIPVAHGQVPLGFIWSPKIDLSQLSDLKGTIALIQQAGLM
jgi:iron(III) transport system substrate-binding protein